MKIVDYLIIAEESRILLEHNVSCKLNHGWEPIGGVSVVEKGKDVRVLQAMVKYASDWTIAEKTNDREN